MELDMEFDGDEDDDGEIEGGSGRSGSAELDEEGEGKDWKGLALGSGSGGVKGRRKGMVFKCENCAKVGHHTAELTFRNIDIQVASSSIDGSILLIGKSQRS
jgi:hypothetical protein